MSLGSLSYLDLFVCVLICYIHISCIICKVKREKRKDISVSKQALHEISAMEEHLSHFVIKVVTSMHGIQLCSSSTSI